MNQTRPRPPESLREEIFQTLQPADGVWEWITDEVLSSTGSIHNEDHAHLLDADIAILWAATGFGKRGRTVIGQAEQVAFRVVSWSKACLAGF